MMASEGIKYYDGVHENIAVVRAFIAAGANVNAVNKYGDTAITFAKGLAKIVEALSTTPDIDHNKNFVQ
ncbi:MAG: hypothetical protein US49_C0001G0296 [candidate division TM6 bacterium GW2011_GWF2_37_49]|nr:MAG: hypothetical protein US49_C0001G0296 [candidate division TM6 bacterium GW2011_GWF2_37_49]